MLVPLLQEVSVQQSQVLLFFMVTYILNIETITLS